MKLDGCKLGRESSALSSSRTLSGRAGGVGARSGTVSGEILSGRGGGISTSAGLWLSMRSLGGKVGGITRASLFKGTAGGGVAPSGFCRGTVGYLYPDTRDDGVCCRGTGFGA